MAANGTIKANEKLNDGQGRVLNIDSNFQGVQAPDVAQTVAGLKAGAAPTPTPAGQQPQPRGPLG